MAFPLAALIPAGVSALTSALGKKSSAPASGGGGGTDWASLLTNMGLGLFGGLSGAKSEADAAKLTREQMEEQRRQFDATLGQTQAAQALSATQMNPLAQQQARQQNAIRAALLGSATPYKLGESGFTGGFQWGGAEKAQAMPFFSPAARSAAESQFAGAANTASGGRYGAPPLAALGYGAAGAAPSARTTPPAALAAARRRRSLA